MKLSIVAICDLITLIVTTYFCFCNLKKITKNSRFLIYYIFVLFYVFPMYIDYVYKFPIYTYSKNFKGFMIANNDSLTRIVYDVIIIIMQWLLLCIKIKKEEPIVKTLKKNSNKKIKILYLGMFLSILIVFILGNDKSILYTFMWRENNLSSNGYIPLAEELSYISICCAVLLFFTKNNKYKFITQIIAIICAYMSVCIEGKRSILFFLLLVIFIVMLFGTQNKMINENKKQKKIIGLFIVLIVIVICMVLFTVNVKMNVRGYSDLDSIYTTIRIDFFRDDRVRMAIYSLLNPSEMKILNYPGETLIPIILNFFPLNYIFGYLRLHPVSYTAYISAALIGTHRVDPMLAFMTPCIFAEFLSNFNFIGVVFMLYLSIWFMRKVEKYPYPTNIFIIISYILLQMYSIAYIAYFLEMTIILCLSYKIRKNRNDGEINL